MKRLNLTQVDIFIIISACYQIEKHEFLLQKANIKNLHVEIAGSAQKRHKEEMPQKRPQIRPAGAKLRIQLWAVLDAKTA